MFGDYEMAIEILMALRRKIQQEEKSTEWYVKMHTMDSCIQVLHSALENERSAFEAYYNVEFDREVIN